jgi:hypothetical protein
MVSVLSFFKPRSATVSVSRSEGSPAVIDLTRIVVTDQKSLGLYLNGIFFNIASAYGASEKTLKTLRPKPSSNIQPKKTT